MLIISSGGGDENLIIKARHIYDSAPELEDWEFLEWKPKKINWDFKILFDLGGIDKIIDISNWYYMLEKNNYSKYNIFLKLNDVDFLVREDLSLLIEIALESILGEEVYLKSINEYVLVDSTDRSFRDIKLLSNEIGQLLN